MTTVILNSKSLLAGFGSFGKNITILLPIILLVIIASKNIYGSIDTKHNSITVAVTNQGKISVITYKLLVDKEGKLYFEYGVLL